MVDLHFGPHAMSEAKADRYGVAELPRSIELVAEDVVELEVAAGKVAKLIVRYPYDDQLDLVLVLRPGKNSEFFVKTCWFNRVSDNHRTLRLAPYSRP